MPERTAEPGRMPSIFARSLLALVLAGAAVAPAAAVAPFSFDTTFGRLPKTVVPVEYRVAVTPDVASRRFHGEETITLRVRAAVTQIVFNTHDITVRSARFDGRAVTRIVTENEKQLTTLQLAGPAPAGMHALALVYDGAIGESPAGLFAQDYRAGDGSRGTMLATQFESTDARRMFPSWDEPAFRATFALSVTLPAAWSAVSNTPVASRTVRGDPATTTFATHAAHADVPGRA